MTNGSRGAHAGPAGESRGERAVAAAFAGLLCAYLFVLFFFHVYPIQWPHEWDTLRDVGIAQTLLDGRFPEDPMYAGEVNWFNPLTGGLIAAAGLLLGTPLPRAAILIGPAVNLLTPVLFFMLAARLLGARAALAGLLLVLFGKDFHQPYWVAAVYSPWLLAPSYAPGLMFLTMAVFLRALETKRTGRYAGAGLLLGATFLAHTAPAMVAGGTMLLLQAIEAAEEGIHTKRLRGVGSMALRFLLLLGIAFGVSLPFSGPILWEYRFHIQNPWPSWYAAEYVSLEQLPTRLRGLLNAWNLVACLGLIALAARSGRDHAARLVLCWTAVALLFVTQHYVWQALLRRGVLWPGVVPGHHAAIHLSAARATLFAAGVAAVGTWAARAGCFAWRRLRGGTTPRHVTARWNAVFSWAAVLAAFACVYGPRHHEMPFRFHGINADLHAAYHGRQAPVYHWILANAPPHAHFLCEEDSVGITTVLPAARKLLDTMIFYSNPYVNQHDRSLLRRLFLAALNAGDPDLFREALDRGKNMPGFSEDAFFLLLSDAAAEGRKDRIALFFEEAMRANGFSLFRLRR